MRCFLLHFTVSVVSFSGLASARSMASTNAGGGLLSEEVGAEESDDEEEENEEESDDEDYVPPGGNLLSAVETEPLNAVVILDRESSQRTRYEVIDVAEEDDWQPLKEGSIGLQNVKEEESGQGRSFICDPDLLLPSCPICMERWTGQGVHRVWWGSFFACFYNFYIYLGKRSLFETRFSPRGTPESITRIYTYILTHMSKCWCACQLEH